MKKSAMISLNFLWRVPNISFIGPEKKIHKKQANIVGRLEGDYLLLFEITELDVVERVRGEDDQDILVFVT